MEFDKMLHEAVCSAISEQWMAEQIQKTAQSAVKKIIDDQFSYGGAAYKAIRDSIQKSCEASLGGLSEHYMPRLSAVIGALISHSIADDKQRLLSNMFTLVDDSAVPEYDDNYTRTITLDAIFEKYCYFVSHGYDTDDREVDLDDNPSYQPVHCTAWIEPEERPRWFGSDFENATLHFETEDGEDKHGKEWNMTFRLFRRSDSSKPWTISSSFLETFDMAHLAKANPMMCYMARLNTSFVHLEDDAIILENDVDLAEEPECSWS